MYFCTIHPPHRASLRASPSTIAEISANEFDTLMPKPRLLKDAGLMIQRFVASGSLVRFRRPLRRFSFAFGDERRS